MSINGVSLLKAATGIVVNGGTATVFTDDGLEVKNGIHVIDAANPSFQTRIHGTFKNKSPQIQPDGTYSKGSRDLNFTTPILLASGRISFQVFRGSFEIHPEMTVAQILEMRLMACQCIMDAEFDAYYNAGSVM